MKLISVIIPCYNQGQYLEESVGSVLEQTYRNIEVIIVNDGSDDPATLSILSKFERPYTRIISTDNNGLATARNMGIAASQGEYILPLDADDRIGSEYLAKAAAVLDNQSDIGFVYCLADLFGAARGKFYLNDASLQEMLLDSRVFCSSLFRKADWEAVGGYNPNMVYGWEDWDFWLSLLELGKCPHLIEEVMFFYRVKPQSMIRSMTDAQKIAMHRQLRENHRGLYRGIEDDDLVRYHRYRNSFAGKIEELMRKLAFNLRCFGK